MLRHACAGLFGALILLPLAARADCHHRRLDQIMDNGQIIQLDDGSQWEISDFDRNSILNWQQDATITACDNELINTEDHETAEARMVRRGEPVPDAN
jgi:hypothetical protein